MGAYFFELIIANNWQAIFRE